MSQFVTVPEYLVSKTGDPASERFLAWINSTKIKLSAAFPKGERAFSRIIDKMRSRLPKRWGQRIWYTRQKQFMVSAEIVYFGDFYFRNLSLLVEIDGLSHAGGQAAERDDWRTRLIASWRDTKVVRITNDEVQGGDFRVIEKWFVANAAECCPHKIGTSLLADYLKMQKENPHIYQASGTLTTY